MPNCEGIKDCAFFNDRMNNMPAMAGVYKKKYCAGNFSECARYMVKKEFGKEKVPMDLFPNQKERIAELRASLK